MSVAHINPVYPDFGLRLTLLLQALALLSVAFVLRAPHVLPIWGTVFVSAYAFGLFERAICAKPYNHFLRTCAMASCVSVVAFLIHASSYSAVIVLLAPPLSCAFGRLVFGRSIFKRRVLVLGDGDSKNWLNTLAQQGYYSPVMFRAQSSAVSVYTLCQQHSINEIVVTTQMTPAEATQLLPCRNNGIKIFSLNTFIERETGRLETASLYNSRFIFCEEQPISRLTQRLKRGLDVACAVLIGVLLLPLLLLGMVLIACDDGLPLFYSQRRVGRDGKLFTIYKLRTMCRNAEAAGAAWAQQNDARITRVGGFLRRSRIDEIPQLWCILRGDMSLVGPRPERPEFTDILAATILHYNDRHCVRPGLTGWAQLCMRYTSTHDETAHKLAYDLYYIKNMSVWFDVAILLKTVRVLLFTDNAR